MGRYAFGWLTVAAGFVLGGGLFDLRLADAELTVSPAWGQVSNPVYVEDSPLVTHMIDDAREFRAQGRLVDAARQYQKIIEEDGPRLITLPDQLYVSAARWIWARMGDDPALLEAYRALYDPQAQHAFAEVKRAEDQIGALVDLVGRYRLTQTGLEASLRLAGLLMAEGRLAEAASALDAMAGHPDLPQNAPRYHQLQAAVGLFDHDPQRLATHQAALTKLPATTLLEELEQWRRATPDTGAVAGSGEEHALPAPLGSPLWVRTPESFSLQRNNRPTPRPVIDGDRVYVADFGQVTALDRYSGHPAWIYPRAVTDALKTGNAQHLSATGEDWRAVTLAGDRLLAVVGFPSYQGRPVAVSAYLACLDRRDGSELWQVRPVDLDPGFSNAYVQGTPLVVGGRVYVSLRRFQRTQFHDAFVAALDLETGRKLWTRHLASAMTMGFNPREAMGGTQWLYEQGRIYFSDVIGVAGCLDSADGSVVWLRRTDLATQDPEALRRAAMNAPMGPTLPVMLDAGLLVATPDQRQPPFLLDRHTGVKIREMTDPAWQNARSFHAAGRDVLVVSERLRLIDGQTLKVNHEYAGPQVNGPVMVQPGRVLATSGNTLVELGLPDLKPVANHPLREPGELAVADGQLVVVASGGLFSYMNWEQAYGQLKAQTAANPGDAQAGISLAEVALGQQRYPHILEGADLALAAMQRNVAEPGGDQVAEGQRRLMFERFLSMVQPGRIADVETRRSMLERLAVITSGPEAQVAYHLSAGQFLEETNQHAAAMEHFQTILDDENLAGRMHHWDQGARQAGMEARLRQERLVAAQPALYDRYHAAAADMLARLSGNAAATPEQFVRIARRLPLAGSANEALFIAAELHVAGGQAQAARRLMREAYLMAATPHAAALTVSRAVPLLLATGQSDQARSWLRRMRRDHADLMLTRAGVAISPEEWLAELGQPGAISAAALPTITNPFQHAAIVEGQMLLPQSAADLEEMGDAVVLLDDLDLAVLEGQHMQVRWKAPVRKNVQATIQLLSITPAQVLLFNAAEQTLMALDTATGKRLWADVALLPMLRQANPGADEAQAERQARVRLQLRHAPGDAQIVELERLRLEAEVAQLRVAQQQGGRLTASAAVGAQTLLLGTTEDIVCIADRSGRVVGIDRGTGRELWRWAAPFAQIHHLAVSDMAVAVSGLQITDGRQQQFALAVVDPDSGRQAFETNRLQAAAIWLASHASGAILCVSVNRAEAYDPTTGQLLWGFALPNPQRMTGRAFLRGDELLLEAQSRQLLWVNAANGKQLRWLGSPADANDAMVAADWADNHWHLLATQRAQTLNAEGDTTAIDAIAAQPKNLVGQWVSDRYVIVLNQHTAPLDAQARQIEQQIRLQALNGQLPGEQRFHLGNGRLLVFRDGVLQPEDGAQQYTLYLMDRKSGSLVGESTLNNLDGAIRLEQSLLRNEQLLLTTETQTIVIRGATAQ